MEHQLPVRKKAEGVGASLWYLARVKGAARSAHPGGRRLGGAASQWRRWGPPPVAEIFAEMAEGPRAEGAGPGQAWLDSHGGAALGPFVGGTWLRPKGRKEAQCCEAATGRVVGSVLWGGPEEVAAAVGAAEAAAEQWGRMAAEERALRLERLAEVLERKAAVVAEVEAVASGRPCGEGGGAGLSLGVRGLRVAAAALRAPPPQLQGRGATGVVALVVAPPCSVLGLLWRLTPLLAGGNTAVVLLLPPAEAALGALLLAEMATAGGGVLREGGAPLPPGALNVVCGAPPLPRALRSHPSVRHVVALGDGQVTPPPPQNNPNPPTPPTKFHLCPILALPPRVALYCPL
eukprot:XP_025002022.1 aldehyde dehydrogenase family 16 member A1-like isoform X2 [Gallus gallus]